MNDNVKKIWKIDELPFHIGNTSRPDNGALPGALRFDVGVREDLGLLVHIPTSSEKEHLATAYNHGSQICTPMGETFLGKMYYDDFHHFLLEVAGGDLAEKDVLEIGFGRGFLIKSLVDQGARAVGFDPSQGPSEFLKDLDAELHYKPFDAGLLGDRKFDLIVHCCVMEHLPDPVSFAKDILKALKPGGKVVFSVPDCGVYIERGDLGMFVHEHLSYFDVDSLGRLAGAVGAEVLSCEVATNGGILLVAWGNGGEKSLTTPDFSRKDFCDRARDGISIISRFLEKEAKESRSVGIFCPGRFFNYHHIYEGPSADIRYFDDNDAIVGSFFPPIDVVVESRAALLEKPVDTLLIMSRSFGQRILDSLQERPEMKKTRMVLLETLF